MSVGQATGEINILVDQAERNLQSLENSLGNLDRRSAQHAQALQAVGTAMAGVGAAGVAAFGVMINSAANFEEAVSNIEAAFVDSATPDQMKLLADLALQLGADTSKSATEAAAAIEVLGLAGISAEDTLNGAAQAAIELSEASGGDLVQSTEILSAAMEQFNIAGEEATRVTDALAGAAQVSLADMSDLGYGLAQVGGIAASFNFTVEETTAALAVMASNGMKGSDAATSMKTTFLKLINPVGQTKVAMDELGLSITNADGSFKSFEQIMMDVDTATKDMTESQRAQYLTMLAGQDGVRFLTFMMEALNTTMEDGRTQWDHYLEATSGGVDATEIAAIKMDNTRGSIERLMGSLETLSVRVGSFFLPAFRAIVDVLDFLVDTIANLPTAILAPISILGALGSALLLVGGTAMVVAGRLMAMTGAATAMDAIRVIAARAGVFLARLGINATSVGAAFRSLALIAVRAIGAISTALFRLVFGNPILAALSVALMAYANNWLGFRDVVNSAVSGAVSAISRLVSWVGRVTGITDVINAVVEAFRAGKAAFDQFNQAGSTVGAVFKAISAAIASLNLGPLNQLASLLNVTGEAINRFWRGFGEGGGTTEATIRTNIEVSGDDKVIEWVENADALDGTGFDYMVRIKNPDGSLGEWGQIVESYDDESNAMIKHIKVKTDEGEYWTTYDTVTGEMGDATIEIKAETKQATKSVDRFTKRLAKGMREAGEYLSESNFRPLQTLGDWLLDGADNLDQFGDAFRTARNLGLNPFMATVRALGVTFPALSGPMATVERTINNLTSSFRRFRDDGATPVQAALSALGEVFPALSGVTESLGDVFDNLGDTVLGLVDAFQAAITGDWAGVFTGLQSAAFNAWDAVQAGIDLVRELASGIGTLAVRIGGWAWDQAVDLYDSFMENWPSWRDTVVGIVHDVGDLAAKVGRWLLEQGQSLAGAIAEHWPRWVASAKALALDIGELAAKVGGWLITQGQSLAGKIAELWPGWVASAKAVVLDIGELAAKVGGWAVTQAQSIAGKIQELWPRWAASAQALILDIPSVTARILDWVVNILAPIKDAIEAKIGTVVAELTRVVLNIFRFNDVIISQPVDRLIADTIGTVTAKLVRVVIEILQWALDADWGELQDLVRKGAVVAVLAGAAAIVAPTVAVPIVLALGVVAAIGLTLAFWGYLAQWARNNPGEAIDLLIDIALGLGDISERLPSKRQILDMALGFLGIPTTKELEIDVKVVLNFIFGDNDAPDKEINKNLGGDMDNVIKIGTIELDSDGFVINEKGQRLIGPDGQPLTAEDLTGMADRMASNGIRMTDAGFQLDPSRFHWENEGEIQSLMQQSFTNAGRTALTSAGSAIGAAASTALGSVGTAIGTVAGTWGTAISSQAGALGAAATTAFGGVNTGAVTGLTGVGTTISTQSAGWGLAVAGTALGLQLASMTAFAGVNTGASAALGTVGTTIATQSASWGATMAANVGSMAATTVSQFAGMSSTAVSTAAAMGTAVGSAASTMASNVGSRVSGMASDVGARMLGMRMGAALEASSMQQAASTSASTMQRNVQTSATNMALSVGQSVSAMRQNAVTQTANMATQIIAAMQMMGSGVQNAVSSAFGRIAGIIASSGGTAINAAYMVGVAIGQGLANGINSMVGAVAAATANLVNAAAGAAAAAALAKSPSRLFMWQGEDIGEGMAIGIDNKQDRIERSARDLVESASAQALRTSIAINGLTGGSPFVGTVPLVARGASRSYAVYRSVNFEAGSIVQQAGESVEDLADRVVAKVFSGFDDSGDIWEQR